MSMIGTPYWIATLPSLKNLAAELEGAERVAVDTESNSLHAYREQVCLIQFSTLENDYLVDPFATKDLSPLASLFANPEIEKVFHAAEYDLICLKRDFNFDITNIFDTMQSARILGYKQVGLDALLALKFNLQVDKRYQKADWAKRPLTAEQLNYARQDTHYLLPLRDLLRTELEATGKWDLAHEEFNRLAAQNGTRHAEVPAWQRIGNTRDLNNQQMAILQALSSWRELAASRMDRPPFKIIDDRRLVSVAQAAPSNRKELETVLSSHQVIRYGGEILTAISRARQLKPVERPRVPRPPGSFLRRLDLLNQWRKATGLKLHLETDIILPRNWMQSIAEKNPQTMEELSALMPNSPWRIQILGEEILKTIGAKGKKQE